MNFGQAKTARKVVGAVHAGRSIWCHIQASILYIIFSIISIERKVGYGIENF